MTILHIDNSPAVTGAFKALMSWCMDNPQWRHIWVLPAGSAVKEEAGRHFKVYELPFTELGRSVPRLLRYLPALWRNGRALKRIILQEQPDLIHINDLYNLVPYAARKMGRFKIPIVVHARMLKSSFPARIYSFWKKWHLAHADGIVAVSKAVWHDWDDNNRVHVIYDPITVREQHAPYQFLLQEGRPFRFLYLANYIPGKGQEDALDAIKLVKETGEGGFTVDFYGDIMGLEKNAAYKKELEAYAVTNGLKDITAFHGPVQDVEETMKQYDALLHFSHAESFGMICYEALYYGLPVVSSKCGGPEEMIADGATGYLLPLRDTRAYATAIQKLITHPIIAKEFSGKSKVYLDASIVTAGSSLGHFFESCMKK